MTSARVRLAGMAIASAALHAGSFALLARLPHAEAAVPEAPVEVAFEVAEPPPPAPAPVPAPPPARPARVVAAASLPPAPATPPLPPPPNEPSAVPPAEPPRARPAIRVGVSLSSTATGGSFAVGVGNTLHGRAAPVAADPSTVRPYAAEGTAPATRLSAQPKLLDAPEIVYPDAARHEGVEGKVVLLLRLDATGAVVDARVLAEPGAGLGEAAREGARRFRFTPALLDGEPVATELRFTYTFVLE